MMLHPSSAHFAVVLPLVALIISLLYLYKKDETFSKLSTSSMVLAALFIVIAYFTGKDDAKHVFEFLSSDAKGVLVEHAKPGKYLAIAIAVVAVINLFGFIKKIFKVQIVSIILLALVVGGVFLQGKKGGELTYTYGAHVNGYADGQACIAEAAAMDDDDEDEEEEE